MIKFSERLDEALKKRDVSPAELARRIGVNEGAISNYRRGRYSPKQNRVEEIATALGVSIAWLMGADVPMYKEKSSPELSEEEKELLELFRSLPEDKQKMVLEMLKAALSTK